MNEERRIIRTAKGRSSRFARIENQLLQDKRLSFRTRGVLAYLFSKPDNWRFSAASLSAEGIEGNDALERTIREAVKYGYIRRQKIRGADGRIVTVLTVHESPSAENRQSVPVAGYPAVGEAAVLKTTVLTNDCRNDRKEETTPKAGESGFGDGEVLGTIKNPIPLPKTMGAVEKEADRLSISREVAHAFARYQAAHSWKMNGQRLVNWPEAMRRWAETDARRVVKMDKINNEEFWRWVDSEGLEKPTVSQWIRLNQKNHWQRMNKLTGRREPISDYRASCLAFCKSELAETLERIGWYDQQSDDEEAF